MPFLVGSFHSSSRMINLSFHITFRPQDRFNLYDLAVVVASLIESFVSTGTGFLSALRVVRVFRCARSLQNCLCRRARRRN